MRFHTQTAGVSLTAQQPMNNVVRASVEALTAALGGVQTMHVCAYDEALGVPTEQAATLALRTQQVVAFETGLTETVDPMAGSYAVETLTDEIEREIVALMRDIADRGGALACIEAGWFARELSDAAYEQARLVESGERPVVGVNRFASPTPPLEVFEIDPEAEAQQVHALSALRKSRDAATVEAALGAVREAARAGENVVPACVEAVRAYATVGEVVGVLRDVHGSWTPSTAY
jgi:methylmalonyl-CoA mutase, N-terminal domain